MQGSGLQKLVNPLDQLTTTASSFHTRMGTSTLTWAHPLFQLEAMLQPVLRSISDSLLHHHATGHQRSKSKQGGVG